MLSSLPGPPQVEAVALGPGGILEGIRPGALYADLSTSSPLTIRKVREAFEARDASAIDTPVSGGTQHSREGTLTFFVGAEDDELARVRPVLEHLAREIFHVGPVSAGCVAKIANNAVGLSTLGLLSEVLSLGAKAGIDHRTLLKVLREGAYGQGLFLTFMLPRSRSSTATTR